MSAPVKPVNRTSLRVIRENYQLGVSGMEKTTAKTEKALASKIEVWADELTSEIEFWVEMIELAKERESSEVIRPLVEARDLAIAKLREQGHDIRVERVLNRWPLYKSPASHSG
jgi:hypothetical protein